MRGFRFRSSLNGFAARVFGLQPNTCRPAADKTKLPVAREKKTSGTQGKVFHLLDEIELALRDENHFLTTY